MRLFARGDVKNNNVEERCGQLTLSLDLMFKKL